MYKKLSIFGKIKVMWLKRRLVKYLDEYTYRNKGLSKKDKYDLEVFGFPTNHPIESTTRKIFQEWYGKNMNLNKEQADIKMEKLKKLIADCKQDRLLDDGADSDYSKVSSKGREFIKWHFFIPKLLNKLGLLPTFQHIITAIFFFLFGYFVKQVIEFFSK